MTGIPDTALGRVEAFVEALEHHGHGRSIVSCRHGHEAHWPGENHEYVPLHAGDLRDLVDGLKQLQAERDAWHDGAVTRIEQATGQKVIIALVPKDQCTSEFTTWGSARCELRIHDEQTLHRACCGDGTVQWSSAYDAVLASQRQTSRKP